MNKYPEYIMRMLRERKGDNPNDTDYDYEINTMSSKDVFNEVLNWNGITNYGNTIIVWIKDIFAIELK